MVVYIDESGTHRHPGHASAAVVYLEVESAEAFEKTLREVIGSLRMKQFHWADERWLVRNKFLERIMTLDFSVKIALFEPPVHPESIIDLVFQHMIIEKNIQRIVIDGEKPKWYERRLKKVLRDKGVSVRKLRTARSTSAVGLQLADALAGLARYYVDHPTSSDAAGWWHRLKKEHKLIGQFVFEPVKNPARERGQLAS